MATLLERVLAAWSSGAPQALDREVEQLASEGHSQQSLEDALETLLNQVRSAGDNHGEEIINGVWDRLTGWCHASQHFGVKSRKEFASGIDSTPIDDAFAADRVPE